MNKGKVKNRQKLEKILNSTQQYKQCTTLPRKLMLMIVETDPEGVLKS